MTSTVEVVRAKITGASTYAEVFGSLPTGSQAEQETVLKKQYRVLVKMIHPDQMPAADKKVAGDTLFELTQLYESAKQAIQLGQYNAKLQRRKIGAETTTVTVDSRVYTIDAEPFAYGDFSNVHYGTDETGRGVVVKVAADPTFNQYLAHEALFLKDVGEQKSLHDINRFMPQLLDTVTLTEPGNEQFRVNIYRHVPGVVSLTHVREVHKHGLQPEDAFWISRRVIAQTLAANMMGAVHGAIVPDHVLINPVSREPLHIGWAHVVREPEQYKRRITTVIDRWRDWYPQEVFDREIPTHQTDLYMAGKTILYLLGGDVARNRFPSQVPHDIVQLIGRLLEEQPSKRPQEGLAFLRELTAAAHRHWGKTYRPLSV